ncbi:hypothetical protein J2X42_004505 [Arthrobacter sp. BE255]|nr:hypothetical protein [Arthrobacter sp. BE255]
MTQLTFKLMDADAVQLGKAFALEFDFTLLDCLRSYAWGRAN